MAFSEIKRILAGINESNGEGLKISRYEKEEAKRLHSYSFELGELVSKKFGYERLDQITMEILFGVR